MSDGIFVFGKLVFCVGGNTGLLLLVGKTKQFDGIVAPSTK